MSRRYATVTAAAVDTGTRTYSPRAPRRTRSEPLRGRHVWTTLRSPDRSCRREQAIGRGEEADRTRSREECLGRTAEPRAVGTHDSGSGEGPAWRGSKKFSATGDSRELAILEAPLPFSPCEARPLGGIQSTGNGPFNLTRSGSRLAHDYLPEFISSLRGAPPGTDKKCDNIKL